MPSNRTNVVPDTQIHHQEHTIYLRQANYNSWKQYKQWQYGTEEMIIYEDIRGWGMDMSIWPPIGARAIIGIGYLGPRGELGARDLVV